MNAMKYFTFNDMHVNFPKRVVLYQDLALIANYKC